MKRAHELIHVCVTPRQSWNGTSNYMFCTWRFQRANTQRAHQEHVGIQLFVKLLCSTGPWGLPRVISHFATLASLGRRFTLVRPNAFAHSSSITKLRTLISALESRRSLKLELVRTQQALDNISGLRGWMGCEYRVSKFWVFQWLTLIFIVSL